MQSTKPELWFSYDGGPFKGNEPFYFDTKSFPWVKKSSRNGQWCANRTLMALIQADEDNLVPYANHAMTSRPNRWKTFGFMFWTVKSRANCKKCPKTWELVSRIPNVLACSFNLLEPGTTIKPHHGDTNAIIRCHLGLVIPGPAPQCAFRVGSEIRGWKDGEILMFCDAHNHTSWNNTGERRYIMVLDIMRPEFAAQTKSICSRVLSAIYLEIAYQRMKWLPGYFGGKLGRSVTFGLIKTFFQLALHSRAPLVPLPS